MEQNNVLTNDLINSFTPQQKERYNTLYSIYGEDGAAIVQNLKSRGQNSWANVQAKALELNKAKLQLKEYYEALEDVLFENNPLNEDLIIQLVSECRSDNEMPTFVKQIKLQCMKEFYKLFIYEEVVKEADDGNSKVKEYRIICRLLCRD